MKYEKPALSFSAQADRLFARGLVADRSELVNLLKSVNYYRLSAYWYTFRIEGDPDDRLRAGTTLEMIWNRYVFDRQLRLLVMDAIERVEVAIRTQIVNRHVLEHGAFGYLDRANLPGIDVEEHRKLMDKVRTEAKHSREDFVRHYLDKYTLEHDLPLWMACELMTFGGMLTLFMGLRTRLKKDIAQHYGLSVPVLGSWLKTLNQVRNICAHHARLWNRVFGVRAAMPEAVTHPEWHMPVTIAGDQAFGVLTVLYYLLRQVAPKSRWQDRLLALFAQYPAVPLRFMGFPNNWRDCPIWKRNTL
ncbi:MAG: Abi family protein [Kiritimatiellaeota bacterium]|nr:Abi family protein [Kiritimatiellota bacterium]